MRAEYQWNIGRRSLTLGRRTLVMGIVNVTPDSFSDGGRFSSVETAVTHAVSLLDEGADIVDIGGESTRPGAKVAVSGSAPASADLAGAVGAQEELSRVLPVIEGVLRARPEAVVSIDTYKSEVARRAVNSGAEIVNDVSGFTWDETMATTVSELGCGCVMMHLRGRPSEWRMLPPAPDIVALVKQDLQQCVERAVAAGVAKERLVLDPGYGFGKNFDENYPLLAHLDALAELGYPLLVGTSRKSFLGRTVAQRFSELTGVTVHDLAPTQRGTATVASLAAAVLKGAHIVRVHDVRAAVEAVAVADAVLAAE